MDNEKVNPVQDISTRKMAQEPIRVQSRRFKVFFDSLNDAILVHPLKTEGFAPFIEVNKIACERYGYTYDEFLKLSAPNITRQVDVIQHGAHEHRKQLSKTGHLVFETEHIKKSGEIFPVEINSIIFYEEGHPIIIAVVRDISERKRMEAQVRKIRQLESIATLAGGIAHEFNNSLNVVSGNIELLQLELSDHSYVNDFSRNAMGAIKRLTHLTNQLHAYARGGKYRARTICLNELVESVLPDLRGGMNGDVVIEVDLSRDIPSIEADIGQLQMVLTSIVTNALEAMDGRGWIRISTFSEQVGEAASAVYPGIVPGLFTILSVRDTGKGMDAATVDRVFDPFFTTKFQGRGLGMAAVYGIVKNHDGYVYVDSEPGKGTEVKIYFPKE